MVWVLKIEVCVLILLYIYMSGSQKILLLSSCRISLQEMAYAIPLDLSLCVGKRVQDLLHIVFMLYEKVLFQKANEGNWTSAKKMHQGNMSLILMFMWLFLGGRVSCWSPSETLLSS